MYTARDYFVELGWPVGTGQTDGHKRLAALGVNTSIDTATVPEDIWHNGGEYPWMAAATSLEAVSLGVDGAQDSAAGTGIRSIRIDGLDANLLEISVTVNLNGTTPVAIPTQFFRINQVLTLARGSGAAPKASNAGDITIRDAGGGTVRAVVPVGRGFSSQAIFTCPADHTAQIISLLASISRVGGGASIQYASIVNFSSPTLSGVVRLPLEVGISSQSPYRHDSLPGIPVPGGTDVALRVSQVSTNGLSIAGGFLVLFKRLDKA